MLSGSGFITKARLAALVPVALHLLFATSFAHGESECKVNSSEGSYIGECKAGLADGYGVLTLPSGRKLEGEWKGGDAHGKIIMTSPDGYRYEGDYLNGLRNGKGVETWADGDKYVGQFLNNKKHGRGVYTALDGYRYEGEWSEGKQHGKGIRTSAKGSIYEGEFVAGKAQGKGAVQYKGGSRYEGDFADDRMAGKGVYSFPDGVRYEGPMVEGKFSGKGTMTWPNGNRYDGDFLDDKRTGKGVFLWADGGRYEGDFVDGERVGKGAISWKNGNKYEGDFVGNKLAGKGVYFFADGTRYEGDLADGKFSGKGTMTWSNGKKYEGDFLDGKRTGKGVFTWPDSNSNCGQTYCYRKYVGEFVDGTLICGQLDFWGGDSYDGCFDSEGNMKGKTKMQLAKQGSQDAAKAKPAQPACSLNDKSAGNYEGECRSGLAQGFGVRKYSCNCNDMLFFSSCDTCKDPGWFENGEQKRSCETKEACIAQNNAQPLFDQAYAASKRFRCEEALKLDQKAQSTDGRTHSSSDRTNGYYISYSSCVEERSFNTIRESSDPQQMYLKAADFENKGQRWRAKTIYQDIMSRHAKSPIAVKAAERITRLADVEAIESSGQRAAAAARDAADNVRSSNYQQCMNELSACYSRCEKLKNSSSCKSGCAICTR